MGGADLDRRSGAEFGICVCQVDILNRQVASSLYFQGRFVAGAVNVGVISI